jgi:SAM-dependent methyltransferase
MVPSIAACDSLADDIERSVALESVLVQELGGLLPEQENEAVFLASLNRVLDVGCGVGTWATQIAANYPHLEVCGFDIDETKIAGAAQLSVRGSVSNVTFRRMNLLERLDYPNEFFDLITARSVSLRTSAWPIVLSELFRITRPGGFIRFSETEDVGVTTSPAFETLSVLFLQACRLRMISFSPTGRSMGVVSRFLSLLSEVGYVDVHKHAALLDWSVGRNTHDVISREMISAFRRSRSYIAGVGVASERDLEQLYRDLEREVQARDFCALWTFYTLWAKKPT